MSQLGITYSLADQDFVRTKSIGILNVSRWLCHWLAQSDSVKATTLLTNRTIGEVTPNSSKLTTVFDNTALRGMTGRVLWDQWAVYSAARRAGNEWLFLPKGYASFVRKPACKLAVYVHDDIVCHYARNFPGAISKMEERYFLRCLRATLQNADIIFTNTEFSRLRILHNAIEFGLPEPPVVVCGVGFEHIPITMESAARDVIVLVGTLPHKCGMQAVEFTKRWQQESHFDGQVHFIGSLPDGVEFPRFGNWTLHPRLPNDEYKAAMKSAKTLVYFSEYEGFGLPPVEAILGGASTVYSKIPATTEVLNGAGFAFSNDSFDSFVAAMANSMKVSPEAIGRWQSQLRERHSWRKTTGIVLAELSKLSG